MSKPVQDDAETITTGLAELAIRADPPARAVAGADEKKNLDGDARATSWHGLVHGAILKEYNKHGEALTKSVQLIFGDSDCKTVVASLERPFVKKLKATGSYVTLLNLEVTVPITGVAVLDVMRLLVRFWPHLRVGGQVCFRFPAGPTLVLPDAIQLCMLRESLNGEKAGISEATRDLFDNHPLQRPKICSPCQWPKERPIVRPISMAEPTPSLESCAWYEVIDAKELYLNPVFDDPAHCLRTLTLQETIEFLLVAMVTTKTAWARSALLRNDSECTLTLHTGLFIDSGHPHIKLDANGFWQLSEKNKSKPRPRKNVYAKSHKKGGAKWTRKHHHNTRQK